MKKGISVFLSWVLLVAFSVTIATVVFGWAVPYFQNVTKNIDDSKGPDLYCADASFRLQSICTRLEQGSNLPIKSEIKLVNSGAFSIKKLTVERTTELTRQQSCEYSLENPIEPGTDQDITLALRAAFNDIQGNPIACPPADAPQPESYPNRIVVLSFVPWVEVEGQNVACPQSRLTIKDINMLNTQC